MAVAHTNDFSRRRRFSARVAVLLLSSCAYVLPDTAAAALSRDDVRWLNRVTYGVDSATITRYRELGRQRFLAEQLSGRNETLPAAIQQQLDAMEIARVSAAQELSDADVENRRIGAMSDEQAKQAATSALSHHGSKLGWEAASRELLRAIYSPAQLKEQMVWFWLNHFSVSVQKPYVKFVDGDYAEHAIRPYALGKFRDLVMATLKHPAMLLYLDNLQNAAGQINENYARELLELHALGADAGYSQRDVQELARILTGVGITYKIDAPQLRPDWQPLYIHESLFEFNPARHDFGDKTLLGQAIHGRGFGEVEEAVDLLTRQDACARFISRKLALYFVADEPPAQLVAAMAHKFHDSDGDIAEVLRVLFESPEFAASLDTKFKDPMHYVVSALRLAYDGKWVTNAHPVANWLIAQDAVMFGRNTPDGFPLDEGGWASSDQLARRFEVARAIGSSSAGLFERESLTTRTPVFPNLANRLYVETIAPYLSKTTRDVLDRAAEPRDWNTYLLASPEFNYH
jgi:uncharacterized protein (DUF1800 family)